MFDAHCHLQDPRLGGAEAVIEQARSVGVEGFACCATRPSDWDAVAALGRAHDDVHPFFGLHPWYVLDEASDGWQDRLEKLLREHPEAGIGEIGLDEVLPADGRARREQAFRFQLDLAIRLRRVVSLHCRRAFHRLLPLIAAAAPLPRGFLVHSFSGSSRDLETVIALGGHASFSGSMTHVHAARSRKACRLCPPDRLLAETDAPDMMPRHPDGRPLAEGPTRPDMLVRVVEEIAVLRMEHARSMGRSLAANARALFPSSEGGKVHG